MPMIDRPTRFRYSMARGQVTADELRRAIELMVEKATRMHVVAEWRNGRTRQADSLDDLELVEPDRISQVRVCADFPDSGRLSGEFVDGQFQAQAEGAVAAESLRLAGDDWRSFPGRCHGHPRASQGAGLLALCVFLLATGAALMRSSGTGLVLALCLATVCGGLLIAYWFQVGFFAVLRCAERPVVSGRRSAWRDPKFLATTCISVLGLLLMAVQTAAILL